MEKLIYWAPRALAILYICFIGMFALDVFNEGHGFWTTLGHLFMHLVPSFVLVGMLALAWRWEWVGAVLFAAAGGFFFYIGRPTLATKVLVSAPAFFTALLFVLSWRWRKLQVSRSQ